MATVTVLRVPTATGAEEVLGEVRQLQKQHLITLQDAAIVSWPREHKAPRTRQLVDLVTSGGLSGMFWGILLGLIFVAPLLGMAIGGTAGAIGGALRDYGIDDEFIQSVRGAVTPGTSALFLMTSGAVLDRVADALKDRDFEIIATNLSADQERRLRDLFAQ